MEINNSVINITQYPNVTSLINTKNILLKNYKNKPHEKLTEHWLMCVADFSGIGCDTFVNHQ